MNEEKGQSLNIQFNKAIISRAKESNIQMDLMGSVMFVLFGLFEGKTNLLDYADDSNKQRRMIVLYRQLEIRGFLEKDPGGKVLYRLTPKGSEFVTFLKEQYDEELQIEVLATQLEPEPHPLANFPLVVEEDPVGGWIKEYVDIFPAGRTAEGRLLRTAPLTLLAKMKVFIKKYSFDKETILKATKMYIEDQISSVEGHRYTRTANYFISKDKGQDYVSDLATWCQRVVDGDFDNKPDRLDSSIMDMV